MIATGALLGGRYRLVAPIGGEIGGVWLATDQVLDRAVALKLLGEGLHGEQGARRRGELLEDAQAAAQHNRAAVYDYGEDPEAGVAFIVMELLAGATLAQMQQAAATPALPGGGGQAGPGVGLDPEHTVVLGEAPTQVRVEGEAAADPTATARLPLPELGAPWPGGAGGNGHGGASGPDSATTVLEWPREHRRRPRAEGRLALALAAGLLAVLLVAVVALAWPRGGRPGAAPPAARSATTVAAPETTQAQGQDQQPFPADAFQGAFAQAWQVIMRQLAAGQIRPDVATDFGNLLQQLQQAAPGQDPKDLRKQLSHLNRKVTQRLREGAIASSQAAAQIRAAMQQLAASLGLDHGGGSGGDNAAVIENGDSG